MISSTTSEESPERFEPTVTFDDETVRIDVTRQLAVAMSRDEFELFLLAIRIGHAEHHDRVAEIDHFIDQRWPQADPAVPEHSDPFALGGIASLVFGS